MKYKITYKHIHEGSSQTVEFEKDSELDLSAENNRQLVEKFLLSDSRKFSGSGIGSVSLISIQAI